MDEYPLYPGDFGAPSLDLYSKTQDVPRIPAHILFDEKGRRMRPLGRCAINGRDGWLESSADNSGEIELGFSRRSTTATRCRMRSGSIRYPKDPSGT